MIPLRVAVSGFMSYRDPAELVFEGAPLWVLSGPNGAGKSAIFDAITYALYGVHRGGAQNAKALVNHDAKGLSVEFDFAIGEDRYRVKRTLGKKGAPTVQAFRLSDGDGPEPVAETETKAGFDEWVLETIGLDARTFTASVLLQQGRSEALLDADPKVRHEMLGQIIDLSAYERLWERAEARHKEFKSLADSFRVQLEGAEPVEAADLERLAAEAADAGREAAAAREALERVLALAMAAERWAELESEREALDRAVAEAADLTARAEEIERRAARLDVLERTLPALEDLAAVERDLAGFAEELVRDVARMQAEVDALAEAKSALPWLRLAARSREAAREAEAREREAEREAATLAASIDEARAAAERAAASRDAAARATEEAERRRTEAATLLGETQRRLARFDEVDGATACSYCGQPLTAEHLAAERARLERELEARETAAGDAERVAASAVARRDRLAGEARTAEQEAADLSRRHERAAREAAAAREARERETAQIEAAVAHLPAAWAEREVGEVEREAETLDARRAELDALLARVRERDRVLGRREAARKAVARAGVDEAETARLDALRAEREGLAGAGEERGRLEKVRREGHARDERLRAVAREAERIPAEARRAVADVRADERAARERQEAAEERRRAAEGERRALEARREQRGDLERRALDATRRENLYRELARLLGRDRLQRHLLQRAETAIVANANDVLDRISGGTLWLELRKEAEGIQPGRVGKALDLVAYNSETGGDAIPVAFLSGSQRFRVAVSLALGIGRYAGQGGRRIESVIIDEGFGSLDRKGRREMIDELHALKSALDRIILVSHQEEFAEAFTNKYRIDLVDGTSRATLADAADDWPAAHSSATTP